MENPSEQVEIATTVNGRRYRRWAPVRMTATDFLRETLELTGTHLGCEHGVCGACTILLDGRTVRSCILYAPQLDGRAVTTVEGLETSPGELHPIQEAFRRCHGLQCGFCTPGFLLTVHEYLTEVRAPDEAQIRHALSGNICRCTGYQGIIDAVAEADRLWVR